MMFLGITLVYIFVNCEFCKYLNKADLVVAYLDRAERSVDLLAGCVLGSDGASSIFEGE